MRQRDWYDELEDALPIGDALSLKPHGDRCFIVARNRCGFEVIRGEVIFVPSPQSPKAINVILPRIAAFQLPAQAIRHLSLHKLDELQYAIDTWRDITGNWERPVDITDLSVSITTCQPRHKLTIRWKDGKYHFVGQCDEVVRAVRLLGGEGESRCIAIRHDIVKAGVRKSRLRHCRKVKALLELIGLICDIKRRIRSLNRSATGMLLTCADTNAVIDKLQRPLSCRLSTYLTKCFLSRYASRFGEHPVPALIVKDGKVCLCIVGRGLFIASTQTPKQQLLNGEIVRMDEMRDDRLLLAVATKWHIDTLCAVPVAMRGKSGWIAYRSAEDVIHLFIDRTSFLTREELHGIRSGVRHAMREAMRLLHVSKKG